MLTLTLTAAGILLLDGPTGSLHLDPVTGVILELDELVANLNLTGV
jgi:hypothetical protein